MLKSESHNLEEHSPSMLVLFDFTVISFLKVALPFNTGYKPFCVFFYLYRFFWGYLALEEVWILVMDHHEFMIWIV